MQEGRTNELDKLGSRLSLVIGCGVKYPGYNKDMFVCNHGMAFPLYRLRGSDDWSWAKKEHDKVAR